MAWRQVGCISAVQLNDFILAVHFAILTDNKYIASAQLHNQTKNSTPRSPPRQATPPPPPSRSSLDEHASTTQSQLPPDRKPSSRHNRFVVSESSSIRSWYGEPLDRDLCATPVRCLFRRFRRRGGLPAISNRDARRLLPPTESSDPSVRRARSDADRYPTADLGFFTAVLS